MRRNLIHILAFAGAVGGYGEAAIVAPGLEGWTSISENIFRVKASPPAIERWNEKEATFQNICDSSSKPCNVDISEDSIEFVSTPIDASERPATIRRSLTINRITGRFSEKSTSLGDDGVADHWTGGSCEKISGPTTPRF